MVAFTIARGSNENTIMVVLEDISVFSVETGHTPILCVSSIKVLTEV